MADEQSRVQRKPIFITDDLALKAEKEVTYEAIVRMCRSHPEDIDEEKELSFVDRLEKALTLEEVSKILNDCAACIPETKTIFPNKEMFESVKTSAKNYIIDQSNARGVSSQEYTPFVAKLDAVKQNEQEKVSEVLKEFDIAFPGENVYHNDIKEPIRA